MSKTEHFRDTIRYLITHGLPPSCTTLEVARTRDIKECIAVLYAPGNNFRVLAVPELEDTRTRDLYHYNDFVNRLLEAWNETKATTPDIHEKRRSHVQHKLRIVQFNKGVSGHSAHERLR